MDIFIIMQTQISEVGLSGSFISSIEWLDWTTWQATEAFWNDHNAERIESLAADRGGDVPVDPDVSGIKGCGSNGHRLCRIGSDGRSTTTLDNGVDVLGQVTA